MGREGLLGFGRTNDIMRKMTFRLEAYDATFARLIARARQGSSGAGAILMQTFACKVYTREEILAYQGAMPWTT